MEIGDLLSSDDTMHGIRVADKAQLLNELARKAAKATGLDAELIADELRKREELGSTGMGDGVAIPHARLDRLTKPFGLLVRLGRAIDFASIDDKPVDLVFVLLLPPAPAGAALDALATVARRLREPEVVRLLRQADDAAELYRSMTA